MQTTHKTLSFPCHEFDSDADIKAVIQTAKSCDFKHVKILEESKPATREHFENYRDIKLEIVESDEDHTYYKHIREVKDEIKKLTPNQMIDLMESFDTYTRIEQESHMSVFEFYEKLHIVEPKRNTREFIPYTDDAIKILQITDENELHNEFDAITDELAVRIDESIENDEDCQGIRRMIKFEDNRGTSDTTRIAKFIEDRYEIDKYNKIRYRVNGYRDVAYGLRKHENCNTFIHISWSGSRPIEISVDAALIKK